MLLERIGAPGNVSPNFFLLMHPKNMIFPPKKVIFQIWYVQCTLETPHYNLVIICFWLSMFLFVISSYLPLLPFSWLQDHETRCTSGFLLPLFLTLNFPYSFNVWIIAKTTVMFITYCFKCLCVSEQLFCHLKMYSLWVLINRVIWGFNINKSCVWVLNKAVVD